jgi:hypothetical protein
VVKKVKAQSRHNVGTTTAQKGTNVFQETRAKFLCQISAQKLHKNCTKHAQTQNKTHKSTKQAQKGHKLSTEEIINLE